EELAEAHVNLPHVDRMLGVLERVERLVRTSLAFGRPSTPRPAAHRPADLLATAATSVAPRTERLGGPLTVEVASGLPEVFVDDGQMVQVLVILLNNALDAAGSARRVFLCAALERPPEAHPSSRRESSRPAVRFDVRDFGPGIPSDILGRIFDPFFTTKASGTGLGLSIAQQLAAENGARIELDSHAGGPTTFSILVPVAAEPSPASSR
ncbi:MAG TPA: ATP-binding protein, partial [Polyangiaceae bacterium]